MAEDNRPRLVMRSTETNTQTGESETWEDEGVGGNKTPVAKTLPNVTVTPDSSEMSDATRKAVRARNLGALQKYGDSYKTIWEKGGYKPRRYERAKSEERLMLKRSKKNPQTGEWENED